MAGAAQGQKVKSAQAAGVVPGPEIDCIVIGRNEGARLIDCLNSLQGQFRRVVYVDSGSTDGSLAAAENHGATVVALDMTQPFTAARARNAGLTELASGPPGYVQFIDGDCMLREGWVAAASEFLMGHPRVAVVCGRRRERFPEASVYNRLCDLEWDTPVGQTRACGGDAMMRYSALAAAGGYRDDLVAGEEPELCLRLRRAGWQVWRLDAEMTWHDAAITRFGQWVRRSRRAGHAFAEGAALHGAAPDRHWVAETRRAVLWGLVLPLAGLLAALIIPAAALLLLAYPAQILRLAWRWGAGERLAWERAVFTVLGKFPEALGVLDYWTGRLRRRKTGLFEYK